MDILCPTDFTPAAETALAHATQLALRSGASITLLHVVDKHERRTSGLPELSARMDRAAQDALQQVRVTEVLREGDPLKQIIAEAGKGHALMVAGTHGVHGLRQSLLGADMLKLVRHVDVPSLVVQERSTGTPGMARIVLPVSGHSDIAPLLDAVCYFARLHGSEVHVYQLMRPGEQPSEQLLKNKSRMVQRLAKEGIAHVEANEPSVVFSVGFAEQTIRYAEHIGAGAIAIMAKASDEYRWIADAEKERLLTNAPGIPVLCAV
ncbi:MAG: universal stress protein [Bacteroidetes bacterium]|nr:universal stress protein [Bacteroidota bacterium]